MILINETTLPNTYSFRFFNYRLEPLVYSHFALWIIYFYREIKRDMGKGINGCYDGVNARTGRNI